MRSGYPKKWVLLLFLLLGLSGCLFVPDPKVAEEIAGRLQVTPSWTAIRSHLSMNVFKAGMTRGEVHQILDRVGPWEISTADTTPKWDSDSQQRVYGEVIRFTEENTFRVLGYWGFMYAEDDTLIEQEIIDLY